MTLQVREKALQIALQLKPYGGGNFAQSNFPPQYGVAQLLNDAKQVEAYLAEPQRNGKKKPTAPRKR